MDSSASPLSGRSSALRALLVLALALAWTPASHAQFLFAFGGPGFDEGIDVGLDAAGNAYYVGTFDDTLDFDPGDAELVFENTSKDVYVSSFDAAGAFRYAFRIGNQFVTGETVGGIAVDDDGTFFVTGSQPFGAIDFDPDTSEAVRAGELFLASYESDGAFRFAVTPEGLQNAAFGAGNAVALDERGHVYLTGRIAQTIDFNPDTTAAGLLTSAGSHDIFVASYTYDGDFRYAFRLGGPNADEGLAVAADSEGNVYVSGFFRETAAFDPDDTDGDGDLVERTVNGGVDLFFASYDSTGTFRFVYTIGSPAPARDDAGRELAVDANDNVYLAGTFHSTLAFDPDDTDGDGDTAERTASGNGSAFLASYTSEGVFRFVTVPTGSDSGAFGLDTDDAGRSFVTGWFNGALHFVTDPDTTTLEAGRGSDVFVAGYDSTGAFRRAFSFGGNGLNTGHGIAVADDESIALTGEFSLTTDFDPGDGINEHTSAGQNDGFLARFAPDIGVIVAAEHDARGVPDAFRLSAAYPNPFNPQTQATLVLPATQRVTVTVLDLLGREVARLHDGPLPAGEHRIRWAPQSQSSGVYLIRAEGDGFAASRRVVLLR